LSVVSEEKIGCPIQDRVPHSRPSFGLEWGFCFVSGYGLSVGKLSKGTASTVPILFFIPGEQQILRRAEALLVMTMLKGYTAEHEVFLVITNASG
jgi:hypothetical protein